MVVYHTDNKATEVVRRGVNTFSVKKRTLDSKKIFITKNFTITHSLYKDGRRAGLSMDTIRELSGIFNSDSSMNVKKLTRGTEVFLVLEKDIWEKPSKKRVVSVEVKSKKKNWTATKFAGQNTETGFYHQDGSAVSTSFLRYPLANFYVSSHFSLSRLHPIYHTKRPHYGVDLASPRGSPVWSTAKGKVVFAGTKGGYGKTVIIQHDQQYRTVYAHLAGFRKGLKVGDQVNQKQVIGYVGSTGAATGPHLHYEIRKNGQPKNPIRIQLPTIQKLSGGAWGEFKRQYEYYHKLLHGDKG